MAGPPEKQRDASRSHSHRPLISTKMTLPKFFFRLDRPFFLAGGWADTQHRATHAREGFITLDDVLKKELFP
jgi:hypothetical protein